MFSLGQEMRYWLYSEPTDMRKSFHTLSGLVRNKIGGDPMNGDVYIFVNKRRNRIKLLHYETGGMVIYAKMLDRGTFGMPISGSKDVVTDTLVLVPAQMYVRRIIRHKLVLKSNLQIKEPERKAFEIAPLPVMPLPKCMASESLLTDIILQKFFYHMPFYRVIQKYKELGVKISDSTMNDWYAATCEKLKLLYDILDREVFSRDYIQVDESTLPVIDNEKHRAVKGYMWCVRAVEGNLVVFHYDMGSRSHETARKLLRGYRGTIQTDGYGAYDQFESDPHIQVIGCWAHARRKWSDALDEDKRTASEALAYINKLYHVENEAKEAGISGDALKEKRQKESYPVILQFEKWMYETVTKTSRNSRTGKTISYTLPLLPRLSRYVNDGRFCIDNNLVENAIRLWPWEELPVLREPRCCGACCYRLLPGGQLQGPGR